MELYTVYCSLLMDQGSIASNFVSVSESKGLKLAPQLLLEWQHQLYTEMF
jgi:hypothetical protein